MSLEITEPDIGTGKWHIAFRTWKLKKKYVAADKTR